MKTPQTLSSFLADKGQTMAEYGVVLALITIAVVTSAALLGGAVSAVLLRIASFLGA